MRIAKKCQECINLYPGAPCPVHAKTFSDPITQEGIAVKSAIRILENAAKSIGILYKKDNLIGDILARIILLGRASDLRKTYGIVD